MGVTSNPFTGKPRRVRPHPRGEPAPVPISGDYYNRIHLPQNAFYRDAMKEYILRYPKRTRRPEDAIVSAEIYWVHDMNPKWNSVESFGLERTRIFGFDTGAGRVASEVR